MGIPKFNSWLKSRYQLAHHKENASTFPIIDNLYIDMNDLIHKKFRITKKKDAINFSKQMHKLNKELDLIVRSLKPKKLICLAMDGASPLAKLRIQRERRFATARRELGLSVLAENGEEELKYTVDELNELGNEKMNEKGANNNFSSILLSPGTEYMKKIDNSIQNFIQKELNSKHGRNECWKAPKIIFSGQDVPGEGEHKIMDYIRNIKQLPTYGSNLRHAIVGGDADLTLLALASHEPNFIVVRPLQGFDSNLSKLEFENIHISMLRECLIKEFYVKEAAFKIEKERIIDDFILITAFAGNDFLPNLSGINIEYGGLDRLLNAYSFYLQFGSGHLVKDGEIDFNNLNQFLSWSNQNLEQSPDEQTLGVCDGLKTFSESLTIRQLMVPSNFNNYSKKLLHEYYLKFGCTFQPKNDHREYTTIPPNIRAALFKESCENVHLEITKPIKKIFDFDQVHPFSPMKARRKFNKPQSIIEPDLNNSEEEKEHSIHYLEGLQWVMYYYFKGIPSWEWFYPYKNAVLVKDLLVPSIRRCSFNLGEPLSPHVQLMAMLPKNYAHLLPEPLQALMINKDSPLAKSFNFYSPDLIDVNELKVLIKEKAMFLTYDQRYRDNWGLPFKFIFTKDKIWTKKAIKIDVKNIRVTRYCFKGANTPGYNLYHAYNSNFKFLSCLPATVITQEKRFLPQYNKVEKGMVQLIYLSSPFSGLSVKSVAEFLLGRTIDGLSWPRFKEERRIGYISTYAHHYLLQNGRVIINQNSKKFMNEFDEAVRTIQLEYRNNFNIYFGSVTVLIHFDRPNCGRSEFEESLDLSCVAPLQTLVINPKFTHSL